MKHCIQLKLTCTQHQARTAGYYSMSEASIGKSVEN